MSANPDFLTYRVDEAVRRLDELEQWRRAVDVDRADLRHLQEEMKSLAASMDNLRRTLVTFGFTVASAAVVAAFTVLIGTGKL